MYIGAAAQPFTFTLRTDAAFVDNASGVAYLRHPAGAVTVGARMYVA